MEFRPLPGIVTKTGVTYEISRDGVVRSVTKGGVVKILKTKGGRIILGGITRDISSLLQLFDSPPVSSGTREEIFESIRNGCQYDLLISTWGRLKHAFYSGLVVIKSPEDMCAEQKTRVLDACLPYVIFRGLRVKLHSVVVTVFIGDFPTDFEACPVDGNISNARLGNLHLVDKKNRGAVVASFVDKNLESLHLDIESAIAHVINNGFSDATIKGLETSLHHMTSLDAPAEIYGRRWIPVSRRGY